MKMPKEISDNLLAPCGLDCMLCRHHCESDQPCEGCRDGKGKSKHCQICDILKCATDRKFQFCYECKEFPCSKLTDFNQLYIDRFGHEMLPNSYFMKEHGKDALAAKLLKEWACPDCGGVVCIHDNICSECKKKRITK